MEQIKNSVIGSNYPNENQFEHAEYRRYENEDYLNYLYPIFRDDFVIFSNGNKKGLIYEDNVVLNAEYDDISGFDFYFNGKLSDDEGNEVKPHCVILKKGSRYGLFALDSDNSINGKCIIAPIFDSIEYSSGLFTFLAKKGDKSLLLKDTGYIIGEELYDAIIQDNKRRSLYILRNKGKEGFFYYGYFVPPTYKKIQEVLLEHHVADNVLRKNSGEVLFDRSSQYRYIRKLILGDILYGDKVFVFKDDNGYIFIDEYGAEYDAAHPSNESYLLEISGTLFAFYSSDERFQVVESQNEDEEDWSSQEDYEDQSDYEEDTYYALGGEDYSQFKENGGNIDDMMDELGY